MRLVATEKERAQEMQRQGSWVQGVTMERAVRLRRVYDDRSPDDGARVLVDRLWPRGLTKEEAGLDEWCRVVAPSPQLRKWYGHDPDRFSEFRRRYRDELAEPERAEALAHLRGLARQRGLTLLTATREVALSGAAVLAEVLGSDPDAPG